MFYYLLRPGMTIMYLLIAAAVIPSIVLMIKVYKADRLEKESPRLLRRLVVAGILSALLALVEETALTYILDLAVDKTSIAYNIILYFGVVAVSEESSKYLLLRRNTWKSNEFDCQFDGVVYAVFVSLGFALWENISYVLSNGFATAAVRAVTAVPGHACFGVFMGVFYGAAKRLEKRSKALSKLCRVFAVVIPAVIHGAYDFIATMESQTGTVIFLVFIAVLFIVSYITVNKNAKRDSYI